MSYSIYEAPFKIHKYKGLHSVHFYTCKQEQTRSLLFLLKHFYTRILEKEKAADNGRKITFRNAGPALFQRGDRIQEQTNIKGLWEELGPYLQPQQLQCLLALIFQVFVSHLVERLICAVVVVFLFSAVMLCCPGRGNNVIQIIKSQKHQSSKKCHSDFFICSFYAESEERTNGVPKSPSRLDSDLVTVKFKVQILKCK